MAKAKQKKQTDALQRIEHLRQECNNLIDKTAAAQAEGGVPIPVIRQMLTAKYMGCPFRSAQAILENQTNHGD